MGTSDDEVKRNKHLTTLYPEPTKASYSFHKEPTSATSTDTIATPKQLSYRELFAIGFKISLAPTTIFAVFAFFLDIGIGAFLFFFCSGALAVLASSYIAKRALGKFYYENNFAKMSFALLMSFYFINTCSIVVITYVVLKYIAASLSYILIPIVASLLSSLLFVLFVHLSRRTSSRIHLLISIGFITLFILGISFVIW